MESTGDIVVILNADVRPRPDFCVVSPPHYRPGQRLRTGQFEVASNDELFARYVDAMAVVDQSDDPSWMEWTEGFSCRRELAIRAGLFPRVLPCRSAPAKTGFRRQPDELGAKKKSIFLSPWVMSPAIVHPSIGISARAGQGSPQVRRFLQKWPIGMIAAWASLRIAQDTGLYWLGGARGFMSWRATRHSKRASAISCLFLGVADPSRWRFTWASGNPFSRSGRAEKRLQVCRA